MTSVTGTESAMTINRAVISLIRAIGELAPSLPGHSGIFNSYGRIYVDCEHLELAAIECDDPYLLPQVFERQQILVSRAVRHLADDGCRLVIANNNHSELLQEGTSVWGAHENYLVEQHPAHFTDAILPFLVTRFYAGSGGIRYPTGDFLLGVRPLFMQHEAGGGTTGDRAIHSTCREEHHMGPRPPGFRYHLIVGDGHRSAFNLALQFGATALVLKTLFYDKRFQREIQDLSSLKQGGTWVEMLRRLNVLSTHGRPPRVQPMILDVQQRYLDGARRFADHLEDPPAWIPRLLDDWQSTLDATRRMDRAWLAARLDTFTKYELYTAVLDQAGCDWGHLARQKNLFFELALVDQSYHEFTSPRSAFARVEQQGLLAHRTAPLVGPGEEEEPFVPETATRARTRARFIKEHAGNGQYHMDWSWVCDLGKDQRATLADPFAQQYSEWKSSEVPGELRGMPREMWMLEELRARLRRQTQV